MRITHLTTPLGDDVLVLRQLEGSEALSSLFDYTLTAHSTKPDIAARTLIGKALTVSLQDQHDRPHYLNAIVRDVKRLGRDDRHTKYEIKLVPWLWLAGLREDCRIFQQMSVVEIILDVLGKYPFPIKTKLFDVYPTILYCAQYNEPDLAFVCRLMEAVGIGYHFTHEAERHTLVLSDFVSSYDAVNGHETIPFRAPDRLGIADEEVISQWIPCQSIKSGAFITSDYHYRHPAANLEQRRADNKQHDHDAFEAFHWPGQGHYRTGEDGSRIARVRLEQRQQDFETVEGESNVRALALGASGSLFTLREHPQRETNRKVLILASETSIQENPSATGAEQTEWHIGFTVAPSEHPYRPQRVTPLPRIPGPQTATVVGPAGQEVWVNDLGEVKVQFHWDRYGKNDENSSCWVRVSSSWAGGRWGAVMLPRIGDEVIISFLDGNPDCAIVTGRVTNSDRLPPAFSQTGALPGNHALAGIKSRELGGYRYNQLLFDDTQNQLRAQLASEHGSTQLNLGYLTHPRDGAQAAPRGEGFELRTDHWGALRAARGLHITTYAQQAASGAHLNTSEAAGQLQAALAQAKAHSTQAHTQRADALDANDSLAHLQETAAQQQRQGQGQTPAYQEPILVLSSPAGIAHATQKAVAVAAGTDLHMSSQLHTNLSVGRRLSMAIGEAWSVFVDKAGIKLFAGKGKVQIQAQSDNLELMAQKDVQLHSVDQRVEIVAGKEILLSAGGGYIRIAGGNIEIHCPGTLSMKAGDYKMAGPASLAQDLPAMPQTDSKSDEKFTLYHGQTGETLAHRRYQVRTETGQVIEGVSDAQGHTQFAKGSLPEGAHIDISPPDAA